MVLADTPGAMRAFGRPRSWLRRFLQAAGLGTLASFHVSSEDFFLHFIFIFFVTTDRVLLLVDD